MSMTAPQAKAEIASLYQKAAEIENRYPAGLTQDANHEDFNEAKRLLGEIDGLESKLAGLEDAEAQKQRILGNVKKYNEATGRHEQPSGDPVEAKASIKMFGQQFTDDGEYQRLVKSGAMLNPGVRHQFDVELKGNLLDYLTRKALVYSASGQGGNLITNDRQSGIIDILQRQLTLLDLIPVSRTTSNLIEYVAEKTNTNNASAVSEATVTTGVTGLKPESTLAFELKTSPVTTIAEWIPVTNAMLADAPQIQGLINSRLIYHLNQKLEDQVLSGSGTPPELTGILNVASLQTLGLAAGSTYGGQANTADAAFAAMIVTQVTGLANPNAFVFNPIDWAAVRLSRESAVTGNVNPGGYLYGPPSVSGPMTLWGRPVVESIGMTQNTMLVGDFQMGCSLYDREQSAIRVGTINDQMIRNMQTILAEMRIAFAVFRPTAFCRVTGV